MALVTNIDGPNLLDESNGNSCENEVEEDLEDGEIFDEEDDTKLDFETVESAEQNTKPKISKESHLEEGVKEKDFAPQWELGQRSQKSYQKMVHGSSNKPFAGFNRTRGDRFSRNKGGVMKRDVGYLMDEDRPRRKKRRFDQTDEKDPMLRNNQNGTFNRRKNTEVPIEPVEGVNDEEMLYIRGASPDVSNFETFPREFEDEGEDFRPPRDNFGRRGRGRRGGDMDRRNRGMPTKRRMGVGSALKNKRSEDEEKICQYFLQGKCLKENNCTYSHQQPNGRKMELCKFYLMDCCSKEDRCTFMHSEFPCKYYHTGMKCFAGPNCRFSHAKLDEEQKKVLLKSFGKLRYDPPEYENENEDFKNDFEDDSKLDVENNFNTKCDKIPSLLEMQIPVPPELKSSDKNSDEDLEANNNNNNSSTPMPSPSRDDSMVNDTFEINENEQFSNIFPKNHLEHKSSKHHDKSHEKQRLDKEARKKLREERHEEKRIEKNRQRREDLSLHSNDQPVLEDLSADDDDDDKFNDLVIDEEKFPTIDVKEQSLSKKIEIKDQPLPKKIELKDQPPAKITELKHQLLPKTIELKHHPLSPINFFENDVSDESDEYYKNDKDDEEDKPLPTKQIHLFKRIQGRQKSFVVEKKQVPISSPSRQNSSHVEKVDFDGITITDDVAKLLNSLKSQSGNDKSTKADQPSPFHLPSLEQPYDFEETIQEKKSFIEESPASPTCNNSSAVELGKSDVDLRQLPFQFPVAAATEIEASLDSHPPIKYQMLPTQVSVTDYSKIPPTMGIDDPRLRRSITAARDPMFIPNVPVASNLAVRPTAPQKSAPRDPRKPQQDVNTCSTAIRPPLLPTPNTLMHQRPMDSDMRLMPSPIMCPQMMAVRNDPRRKPMVSGDPRQRQRFDVDQRINNNMKYF